MLITLLIFTGFVALLGAQSAGIVPANLATFSFIFLLAGILLMRAADAVTSSITHIAKYLKWQEFVIAFFVMAIGGAIPNLFVGFSAASHNIPELSFGDVVGNSVVDLTLVIAIAVFIGRGLIAESRLVQTSSLLTAIVAIIPLLLILDNELGRGDGIALLLIFVFYSGWLLSKRHLYTQELQDGDTPPVPAFRKFIFSLTSSALGLVIILFAAEGVVRSAQFFAVEFNLPIVIIGILLIGLGSAIPEIYFTISAARKGQHWIILGELMGSVIVLATLVLGTVAIINPIEVEDLSPYAIARFFLIISALFFFIFLRTDRRITYKEAALLAALYFTFVAAELLIHGLGIEFTFPR